jgi:hypothetical protein
LKDIGLTTVVMNEDWYLRVSDLKEYKIMKTNTSTKQLRQLTGLFSFPTILVNIYPAHR